MRISPLLLWLAVRCKRTHADRALEAKSCRCRSDDESGRLQSQLVCALGGRLSNENLEPDASGRGASGLRSHGDRVERETGTV